MASLHSLATAVLATLVVTTNALPSSSSSVSSSGSAICKAYPGSQDWPSRQVWANLNATVDGRLFQPIPPAGVCHQGQPNYNPDQCPALTKQWPLFDTHVGDLASVAVDQFSKWTCLPDPNAPCSADGYPAYVVNATTTQHVQQGVDFARKNNVRLVIKSTGHDLIGRSIAPGSLSINVHYLNSISYQADESSLAGSRSRFQGNSVVVGGGVQIRQLNEALSTYNQIAVGGLCPSVSVGGYISGGGHSILSPKHGLAADNVLEIEVVTPDGKVLTANEFQNKDLFWALRGGGGSTFGVVTKYTLKTFPTPKILGISLTSVAPTGSPNTKEITGFLASKSSYFIDSGVYGYQAIFRKRPVSANVTVDGLGSNLIMIDQTREDFEAVIAPVLAEIESRWPGRKPTYKFQDYPSYNDWARVNYDKQTAGISAWIVSRLLDEHSLTSDVDALGDALWFAAGTSPQVAHLLVGGKGVQEARPVGGSNAVNSAWRNAYVQNFGYVPFPGLSKSIEADAARRADELYEPLRKLTPGSGAYINEAFKLEKNWQHTFWGTNYERLLNIKRKVDPKSVFVCFPCVGSENWTEADDGKTCRV